MNFEKELKLALQSNSIEKIHDVFSKIYSFYGRLVYFTIMKYVSNPSDVEELTQDVFVNFFNNLSIDIYSIKHYLLFSAKNKAIDYLKAQNKDLEYSDLKMYINIADKSNSKNYDDLVNIFKKHLDNLEVEIIIQHIIYGYSFKELSRIYKKPLNTIKTIYLRAKRKLKERCERNEF